MNDPWKLTEISQSGLFSEEVSEELEQLVVAYQNGDFSIEELDSRAEAILSKDADLSAQMSDIKLEHQVARLLNNQNVEVPYTKVDGTPSRVYRWSATMPQPLLRQGLNYLAIQINALQRSKEQALLELRALYHEMQQRPKIPEPPKVEQPTVPAGAAEQFEPIGGKRWVLRSAKSGRFVGLKSGKGLEPKNWMTTREISRAWLMSREEALIQRNILHRDTKLKKYVPGRKNFEIYDLGARRVE